MTSVLLSAAAAGTLLGGLAAQRFGRRVVLLAPQLAVVPAIALLPSFSYAGMILLVVLIGIAMNANVSIALVLAQEYLPGRMGLASGLTIGPCSGAGRGTDRGPARSARRCRWPGLGALRDRSPAAAGGGADDPATATGRRSARHAVEATPQARAIMATDSCVLQSGLGRGPPAGAGPVVFRITCHLILFEMINCRGSGTDLIRSAHEDNHLNTSCLRFRPFFRKSFVMIAPEDSH